MMVGCAFRAIPNAACVTRMRKTVHRTVSNPTRRVLRTAHFDSETHALGGGLLFYLTCSYPPIFMSFPRVRGFSVAAKCSHLQPMVQQFFAAKHLHKSGYDFRKSSLLRANCSNSATVVGLPFVFRIARTNCGNCLSYFRTPRGFVNSLRESYQPPTVQGH